MKKYAMYASLILLLGLACGPKPHTKTQLPATANKQSTVPMQPKEDPGAKINANLPLTRTSDDINSTVSGHMGGVTYCYEKNVTGVGPGQIKVRGQITVEFTITTDGTVKDVSVVQSDIENPAFIECLKDRILHWRFDQISPQGESITVRYPLEFGY
jgi:TonB family protein